MYREALEAIAREAGKIILERPGFQVEVKSGHANYVTSIDKRVEDQLHDALLRLIPGSEFIGEEQDNSSMTDQWTWIVDPVDGTTNLIHDYRCSCISIALAKDRVPVEGLIYQPYTNEMYYAEKGVGALLNGQPIHVTDVPFDKALVAFGTSPYEAEKAEVSMNLALYFLQNCADLRRSGSAAYDLACVACGRADLFFELNLRPWDYAAGFLLVQEAGGKVYMPALNGKIDYSRTTGILAANAVCGDEAQKVIRKAVIIVS